MKPAPSELAKIYPPQGPLQLHRFMGATAFRCFRCGATKRSKLIGVYSGDWERRLCNGCYGRLLSIAEVKESADTTEQRAESLAAILLDLVSADDARRAQQLLRASDRRADLLSPSSLRFLASSEFVATQLSKEPMLEWSPAIIGLCKAVETELVAGLLRPLAEAAIDLDLTSDRTDREIGRVAAFCADPTRKPPELGSIAHFLQTVAHSETRRAGSVLVRTFLGMLAQWTDATWVLNPSGLCSSVSQLSSRFRNPAAHTNELGEADYRGCRNLVVGENGLLWRFALASERHR